MAAIAFEHAPPRPRAALLALTATLALASSARAGEPAAGAVAEPTARAVMQCHTAADLERARGKACAVTGMYAVRELRTKKGDVFRVWPVVVLADGTDVLIGSIWMPSEATAEDVNGRMQGRAVVVSGTLHGQPPGAIQNIAMPCISPVRSITAADEGPVRMKTASPAPAAFEAGPPVDDVARLREWLDAKTAPGAPRRLIRLPVVIERSPLGVGAAHVGARAEPPGPGALRLRLDDSALGISLADRLRDRFGAEPSTVVVWLDGYRGDGLAARIVALAGAAGASDGWPFAVRAVGEPVDGDGVAALVER